MGLNKKFVKMKNDKRAEMGVGTMIIFIAMVLVAAVAASVLISTANTVREQATQTGNDAINNVASGFDIKYVKGTVAGNVITSMDVYIQLSAGSPSLRMGDIIISITAGTVSGEEVFAGVATTDPAGVKAAAAGDDDAGTPASYSADLIPPAAALSPFYEYGTVGQGNLVKVHIAFIGEDALAIAPGASVQMKIMPAHGSTTAVAFTVAPVLSAGTINLR